MDNTIRKHLDNLYSKNAEVRYASFRYLQDETREPVLWVKLAWDDLLALLHGDNHQRAIGAQLLSSLAKSDPDRIMNSLNSFMRVTEDEFFKTARYALQSVWKIGVASTELKEEVIKRLGKRFKECNEGKNCELIRRDIIEVFRKMYDYLKDEYIKDYTLMLIEKETEEKYREKYSGLWNDILRPELQK
jgi:lipoate-protein ligase A